MHCSWPGCWPPRCGRATGRAAPAASNDLLIVGYDREPDTLNRFSTHILEDIQTCVVEGLTTTDEQMNVVPLLAAEVPTLAERRRRAARRTAAWTSPGSCVRA